MELPSTFNDASLAEAELFSAVKRALSAMAEAEGYLAQFHATIPVMRKALTAISAADDLMKTWISVISKETPQ